MHLLDPACLVRIGMRGDPIIAHKPELGQQALQFRIPLRCIVVEDSYAVPGANRFHLRDHAAAFVST